MAQSFDPSLARELNATLNDGVAGQQVPISEMPKDPEEEFYKAFVDPARSRLLLELWESETHPKGRDTRYFWDPGPEVAVALFPFDPVRAITLLKVQDRGGLGVNDVPARLIAMMESDRSQWPVLPPSNWKLWYH